MYFLCSAVPSNIQKVYPHLLRELFELSGFIIMIFHPPFSLHKEGIKYALDTGESKVLAEISLRRVQFCFSDQNEILAHLRSSRNLQY